ncbi:MAG TPA: hypothetical protein DD379_19845 [Cyanobacteria bacterium UBA11162]|nr:hypothetical protein [Cyanobacteria bacterium UBA11162]
MSQLTIVDLNFCDSELLSNTEIEVTGGTTIFSGATLFKGSYAAAADTQYSRGYFVSYSATPDGYSFAIGGGISSAIAGAIAGAVSDGVTFTSAFVSTTTF